MGRLPKVTKLLALAIHFDELLRTGTVTSQAELARLGRVSRPPPHADYESPPPRPFDSGANPVLPQDYHRPRSID